MNTIKLIAVDVDGPLLVDTFSPIMYKICQNMGAEYTRELERNTLSRNREEVAKYLRTALAKYEKTDAEKNATNEERIQYYFDIRQQYMKENPTGVKAGVPEFLQLLSGLEVRLVCYGGLPKSYMNEELGALSDYFEDYICTNDFRPGVRTIVQDIYKIQFNEALFIDDVNFVAEHAKSHRVPFIGIPSSEPWSWQRKDMEETGVKHILESVSKIDRELLEKIDAEAASGTAW